MRTRHSELMKGELNPNFGKPIPDETKKKMSNTKKGKKKTPEHCEKMSLSRKGKSKSEEHKQKISLSQRKPHSEEERAKRRKVNKDGEYQIYLLYKQGLTAKEIQHYFPNVKIQMICKIIGEQRILHD